MACLSEHHNPPTRLCLPGLFAQHANLEEDGSDIGVATGYAAMEPMLIEPLPLYLMQEPNEEFSPTATYERGEILLEGGEEAGEAPPYGYSGDGEIMIKERPLTTDPPKSIKKSKRGSGGGRRRKQVMADGERREKPPKTYISLLKEAIMAQSSRAATLAEIYQYLENRDEFFRGPYVGWKNSVRHNLSISPCFVKQEKPPKNRPMSGRSALARRVGDQNAVRVRGGKMGKGHKWTLVEKTKVAVEEKFSSVESTSLDAVESQESRPLKATAPLRQITKRQPKKQQRRGLNVDCATASPINRQSPMKDKDADATPMTSVIREFHASSLSAMAHPMLETLDMVPVESFSVAEAQRVEMAFNSPNESTICNRIAPPYHRDNTIYFNSIASENGFGELPALTPSFSLPCTPSHPDSDNYYATGVTVYPNLYPPGELAGECWSMPYPSAIQSIPNYPSPNIEGTEPLFCQHLPYINYRAFWELNALQELSPYLCHSTLSLNFLPD